MNKCVPVFSSHQSLHKSILTIEKADESINIEDPISIFTIAKVHGINHLKIAEDCMAGFYNSYILSEKYKIKLSFGLNINVVNSLDDIDNTSSVVTVWIRNSEGYKDLLKINSFTQKEGFNVPDSKGYITWVKLNELVTKNLLVTIPFYSGFLYQNLTRLEHSSIPLFASFDPIFFTGEHELPFDNELKQVVIKYCEQNNYSHLSSHSIYYYREQHAESLQILRCIGKRSSWEKPELQQFSSDKFSFETYLNKYGENFSCEDFDKFFEVYDIKELTNGVRLPDIKISSAEKEKIGLSPDSDNYKYLCELVKIGLRNKIFNNPSKKDKRQIYIDRCKTELQTFKKLGLTDYILLVQQIMQFAIDKKIPKTFGRGSSAGSIVCYLLGIVEVDAIECNLYFSRFVSEARSKVAEVDGVQYLRGSLADVDSDFSFKRRKEVIDFLYNKYPGQISKIGTVSTLSGKILIKEVSKAYLNYNETDAKFLADQIDKVFGAVVELSDAYKESKQFKTWVDKSPENKRCYDIARNLSGLAKARGVHPSGYAISHGDIDLIVPLNRSADGLDLVTSYDMKNVADILIKVDLLSLRNLDVIYETCNLVGLNPVEIDENDPSIYKFLQESDCYHGLFQVESGMGRETVLSVRPKNINNLCACLAIGRPGSYKFIKDFIKFLNTGERKLIFPPIDNILEETGNILIYQEQINRICQEVYHLSPEDADSIRYAVAKKSIEKMKEWEPIMYANGEKYNIPKEVTDYFFGVCRDSADYLFSLNHCRPYGRITAIDTYLKANYPLQFFLISLRMCKDEPDPLSEISLLKRELPKFGIELLPPDIQKSAEDFEIEGNNIRFGLSSIKGVAEKAIVKLASFNREFDGKFALFDRLFESKLGIGVCRSLIHSGCFPTQYSRAKTILELEIYNVLTERERGIIKQFSSEFKDDLFAVLKYLVGAKMANGKPYIKESRFETIRKSYENYKAIYEFNKAHGKLLSVLEEYETLGYSYSGSLSSCYKEEYPEIVELSEATTSLDGEKHVFVCRIKSVKEGKSKAKGTPYVRLEIYDDKTDAIAMIFSDRIEQLKDDKGKLLKEDVIIVVNGTKMDGKTFFLNWCRPLFDLKLAKRLADTK